MKSILTLALCLSCTEVLAQSWAELTPSTGSAPLARRHAGAIHDPVGDRMIIFGGESSIGRLNDTWAFDLVAETWTELTPASSPPVRRTPSVVYDPISHRMLMWSGQSGGTFFQDIWEFDLTNHTWSEFMPPSPMPNQRYGVASVWDPVDESLVTFAGFTFQGRFDDTWRFDPVAEAWSDVSPATNPLLRCLHSASYDSREHRMIMYGGQNGGPLDDIWAFDLTNETWEDLTPASPPPGRFFAAHIYDPINHRATIFGGSQGAMGNTNEVWLFNLHNDTFVPMTPSGTPPTARDGSIGIYRPGQDRMVIFGGHDGDYSNEVWSLNGLSQTVTASPELSAPGVRLLPNYPNPFNPSTNLIYDLADPGQVRLDLYDARGRHVRRLVDSTAGTGRYWAVWDGTGASGIPVASGTYYARLTGANGHAVRKLVLIK